MLLKQWAVNSSSLPLKQINTSTEDNWEKDCSILLPAEPDYYFKNKAVEFWITLITFLGVVLVATVLGIPGNVLSATVFYRQGLGERINLCLFTHALVDLLVDVSYLITFIDRIYRLFERGPYAVAERMHSLAGFVWASQFLSAVIASERCFCVVRPFHAKRLLKTSTMAAIIVVCCTILVGGMMAVLGSKFKTGCWLDSETNLTEVGTIVSRFYLDNRLILDIVDIYVYGFAISGTFLIVVLVTTSITVVKLRSALAWRLSATSRTTTTSATSTTSVTDHTEVMMSSKDHSVTLMLIFTSAMFVVHVIPNLCLQISILIVPDFSDTGRYNSVCTTFWYIVSFLWTLNSSLNCVVYYKMGSKYKDSVRELLRKILWN